MHIHGHHLRVTVSEHPSRWSESAPRYPSIGGVPFKDDFVAGDYLIGPAIRARNGRWRWTAMASADDVIRVARGEVGYVEGGGSSGHNGNITKYWAELEADYQGGAWCAAFVSWVYRHAGRALPAIDHPWGYSYCPSAVAWAKKNKMWDADGHYQPGDIIFFDWDIDGVADHTGIVVADNGQVVTTIEGNTSPDDSGSQSNGGGVYQRHRPHNATILGVLTASSWLVPAVAPLPVPARPATQKTGPVRPVLSQGASGQAVTELQVALDHAGAHLVVDGTFGPLTRAAVLSFQASNHLQADGVVGPQTWGALT